MMPYYGLFSSLGSPMESYIPGTAARGCGKPLTSTVARCCNFARCFLKFVNLDVNFTKCFLKFVEIYRNFTRCLLKFVLINRNFTRCFLKFVRINWYFTRCLWKFAKINRHFTRCFWIRARSKAVFCDSQFLKLHNVSNGTPGIFLGTAEQGRAPSGWIDVFLPAQSLSSRRGSLENPSSKLVGIIVTLRGVSLSLST